MEIIKPGRTYKSTYSGKIACKKCRCVFNYSDNDIEYVTGPTVGVITNGIWVSSKSSSAMWCIVHIAEKGIVSTEKSPQKDCLHGFQSF